VPIPPFIQTIRKKIGHDYLLLPGLVAVVFDDHGRVLLNQRSDSHQWALISGIMEPDEQPATAIARECLEETGVEIRVDQVVDVYTSPVFTHENGDIAQYLTVVYRCTKITGEPLVGDDESLDVRFFGLNELPPLREDLHRALGKAVEQRGGERIGTKY